MSDPRKPNTPWFRPDSIQDALDARQSMTERPGDGPTMNTDEEPTDA